MSHAENQALPECGRALLPFAEEAVATYRKLAETVPDRYRSDPANALNALADLLDALGQQSRAQAARTEAAMPGGLNCASEYVQDRSWVAAPSGCSKIRVA